MNDMVKRVARIFYEAEAARRRLARPWEVIGEGWQEEFLVPARAAIAAMREPTEAMKAVESVHWGYSCQVCGGLKEGWQAMHDEALKD